MAQPVEQQRLFRTVASAPSVTEAMQRELLELYLQNDSLLRQLTIVRKRMDELHEALGDQRPGPDMLLPFPRDGKNSSVARA
jgi:hypothetical protein